jgi:hypothetical protein
MKNNNCNNPPSIYYYTYDSEYDLDIPYGILYRQATSSRLVMSGDRLRQADGSRSSSNYELSIHIEAGEAQPSKTISINHH